MHDGDQARLQPVGRDRVFLARHVRAIEVGVYPDEYGTTQRVRFDVELEVVEHPAAHDEPDRPRFSYDTIVKTIDILTTDRRTGLLETLAEAMAGRLLSNRAVARAHIRLEKLDRLGGEGALGVAIVRERCDSASVGDATG